MTFWYQFLTMYGVSSVMMLALSSLAFREWRRAYATSTKPTFWLTWHFVGFYGGAIYKGRVLKAPTRGDVLTVHLGYDLLPLWNTAALLTMILCNSMALLRLLGVKLLFGTEKQMSDWIKQPWGASVR